MFIPTTNSNQVVQYVLTYDDLKKIFREMLGQVRACLLNAKEEDNNRLVDIAAACNMIHKTRATLWRWEKCGYLKPVMKGTRKLYRYSDLVKINGGTYD